MTDYYIITKWTDGGFGIASRSMPDNRDTATREILKALGLAKVNGKLTDIGDKTNIEIVSVVCPTGYRWIAR